MLALELKGVILRSKTESRTIMVEAHLNWDGLMATSRTVILRLTITSCTMIPEAHANSRSRIAMSKSTILNCSFLAPISKHQSHNRLHILKHNLKSFTSILQNQSRNHILNSRSRPRIRISLQACLPRFHVPHLLPRISNVRTTIQLGWKIQWETLKLIRN